MVCCSRSVCYLHCLGFHSTLRNAPSLQCRQCLFVLMLCLALNSKLEAPLLLAQVSSFNAPSGSVLNYYCGVQYPLLVILSLFYVCIQDGFGHPLSDEAYFSSCSCQNDVLFRSFQSEKGSGAGNDPG